MLSPVVYMTSVRVAAEQDEQWNEFYDDWVRIFTRDVPGTARGSRWSVYDGRVGGDTIPSASWPVYLAFEEYQRIDQFILSRSWRQQAGWEPRVRSFDPWFRHLSDYATLNLQSISIPAAPTEELGTHLLCRMWTIDPESLVDFEDWRSKVIVPIVRSGAPISSEQRYVALLAQLHRYGGEHGELVIPQRHHFEDGGRLCYVDIYELAGDSVSSALLDDLQSATDRWAGIVNDRQDVLAKRQLLVVSDRQDTSSYCAETA